MSAALRRALLAMTAVSLVSGVLLWALDRRFAPRIAAAREELVWRDLQAVLPGPYDNDPLREALEVAESEPPGGIRRVYRARLGGRPAGVAVEVWAPEAYHPPLRLLVGIGPEGAVRAVRVLEQHETKGLGAEIAERRSDWLGQFEGRSLGKPPAERWAVARDGGDFDILSGATITSRAVTRAIARALEFYRLRGDKLY